MKKRRFLATLKSKLVFAVLACYMLVGFPSLIILYSYMNGLVFDQVARVNHNFVADAVDEVNDTLGAVIDAVSWACLNDSIKTVMHYSAPLQSGQTLDVFSAQDSLSAYMAGSPAWDHLNKMIVFNEDGVSFTFTKNRYGTLSDVDLLRLEHEYSQIDYPVGSYVAMRVGRTLNEPYEDALIAYGRMDDIDAYVYAEVDMSVFDPVYDDGAVENLYIRSLDGSFSYPGTVPEAFFDDTAWDMNTYELGIDGLELVYFEDKRPISLGSIYGLGAFLLLLGGSFLLIVVVSIITSRQLTRSTRRLVKHINQLSESGNYGYTDPTIEEGGDEIADIGRTVNKMSLSISSLLERNDRLYEEKKETELSMLQMQVNPHFLYNTLESIHYLAQVQKADGIASMSRGLSHLLKSIAKGRGRMIPLSDELDLVREYDEIQQVRYMGMYELIVAVDAKYMDCLIQEFTLQPLVENAIFHGIEPGGGYGTISITAHDDGQYLYVVVADDGVGMDEEALRRVWNGQSHFKGNMTGVGVRNIDERIRLYYGQDCGLSFTSAPGQGTKAMVKIRLERAKDGGLGDV